MASGLYIVTLRNVEAISVNANDPRMADRCIKVTRDNCKFGKARNLDVRRRNYAKVFGEHNVDFRAFVEMDDIALAERLILQKLRKWRIRGATGRLNEWLIGTTRQAIESLAIATLREHGMSFREVTIQNGDRYGA